LPLSKGKRAFEAQALIRPAAIFFVAVGAIGAAHDMLLDVGEVTLLDQHLWLSSRAGIGRLQGIARAEAGATN